jgi:hypothetical protein
VSNLQSLPGRRQLSVEPLATGAEARLTNAGARRVVVCVNGRQANEVPWIPARLNVAPRDGMRLEILHGSLDHWLSGITGVSASSSRAGRLVSLPRARAWANAIATQVEESAG